MPYIITTETPNLSNEVERRDHKVTGGTATRTRRAVATLDEARDAALETVLASERQHDARWGGRFSELDEQSRTVAAGGGTIGPLPDGTVIVVEHLPIMSLAARIDNGRDYSWGFKDAEIVAAYNAAQGS